MTTDIQPPDATFISLPVILIDPAPFVWPSLVACFDLDCDPAWGSFSGVQSAALD
jgi:hypothetical protein